MKFAALMFIVGTAAAGRLENTYLPPGSAASAGGARFIQTPGFSSDYSAPSAGLSTGSYQGSGGNRGQVIAITQYSNQNNGDGSYQYSYETANGISASESGAQHGDGQAVNGAFSFTGTDGLQYTIHYTADENGFHPEGAHLPTPPPIPEEIRRGVEMSLAAEARGENQDGQYREAHKSYNGQLNAGNGGYQY